MNALPNILLSEKQNLIDKVLERCEYFVQTHIWPIARYLHYKDWLSNFETLDEKFIAAKILLSFLYYPEVMIDSMFEDVMGKSICSLAIECGKKQSEYIREAYYCTIPGEELSPTGSGYRFLTKLRDVLSIPDGHIVTPERLPELLLEEGSRKELSIIFCDDFVGSGSQCIEALSIRSCAELGMPIYNYAIENEHHLAFAPIIANCIGYLQVSKDMPKLDVFPGHVLGPEYNLFDPSCICWDSDQDVFSYAQDLLVNRSIELGINDDASKMSVRGFANQGLFISFSHSIPDAVPAIFYTTNKNWKPLKEKPI